MSGHPQYPQAPYPSGQAGSANPFAEANPYANVNPYAAPQVGDGYNMPPAMQHPLAGLWRQDKLLVMHRSAPLPEICLKSNQKATQRLKRSLAWHHPTVFLLIFLHILLYVVVALIIRKTAIIHIGLTDEWIAIRRKRMLIAWGLVLLGLLIFAGSIPLIVDSKEWAMFPFFGSILLCLGAAIYGLLACRLVVAKRMTDEYIWLKGVHPDFLARLEPWMWNV